MAEILIYVTEACPYCVMAKRLLDEKKAKYITIRIDTDESKRDEMILRTGRRSVPQIIINNQSIGGYDDLYELAKTGELDTLLA